MRVTRSARRAAAVFAALSAPAVVVACGDLVIPPSADGDDGGLSDGEADGEGPVDCDAGEPLALACTGLYSDWASLTLSPDVQPYRPAATMWVDGATSSRWVYLPAGSQIDTTDPNNWSFPVGTKLWQELTVLGLRMETRFLWKETATQWFRATYAWSLDETAAPMVTAGVPDARGLPYEIPPVAQCEQCHDGENDFVLGFEQVGLALPGASGLDLTVLVQQRLLTSPPFVAPVIPADDLATYESILYLHANCGTSCHNRNPDAAAEETGLYMKLTVDQAGALPAAVQQLDTWSTAYLVPSHYTPGGFDAGGFYRIDPGDAAVSMIPWRASRRGGPSQMPPIATDLVDEAGVETLDLWIDRMP